MANIIVRNSRNMRVDLRVLVVDDDPSALSIAKKMLTTKQYHVTTATGGVEALSLLKTEGQFDLVLSDLYMPGIDGFQLLKIVRAVYNIPFLFMSSDHKLDVVERGLEAGAIFFFPKPLTMMNYENMWQFVYIKNVERFQEINIEDQGPFPLPLPHPPLDRSNLLSISDDTHRQGRKLSYFSNTSNGKKRRQDGDHDIKKQKRPYKKRGKEDQDFRKQVVVVPLKKTRVVWSVQLHQKFLKALGILSLAHKKVGPKRILALMKVGGLSKASISSHLQKYRLYQNKYKGTSESNYPHRRSRMCLPDETDNHNYVSSHDGQQDNIHSPNNFDKESSSTHPQYHFQEGSNDIIMAQKNYGNSTAITNLGNLERSGTPTMNKSNFGAYPSLFETSAPLNSNGLKIGSTTNVTPIMVKQQIVDQGMPQSVKAPLVPNFDNLSFESLQNSPPSAYIENIGPLGAWNRILSETGDDEILNNENFADISRMDEIQKGKKAVEEEEDEYSLLGNPSYFSGMNSYMTSQGESFVVTPNHAVVGESSIEALVNPNTLQQGNEVNNSSCFTSFDDIADFLLNQGSKNVTKEECCGYMNPDFDP